LFAKFGGLEIAAGIGANLCPQGLPTGRLRFGLSAPVGFIV
jgi:hypothetical protein